jgi:hypothetical protein
VAWELRYVLCWPADPVSQLTIIQYQEEMLYHPLPHTKSYQGEETLNPKITLIIEQVFPQIVDRHISTRSSLQSAREGLDRYRTMGYQAIRNLPEEERGQNRKALDDAHAAAYRRLEEFHEHERTMTESSARSGSTDAS